MISSHPSGVRVPPSRSSAVSPTAPPAAVFQSPPFQQAASLARLAQHANVAATLSAEAKRTRALLEKCRQESKYFASVRAGKAATHVPSSDNPSSSTPSSVLAGFKHQRNGATTGGSQPGRSPQSTLTGTFGSVAVAGIASLNEEAPTSRPCSVEAMSAVVLCSHGRKRRKSEKQSCCGPTQPLFAAHKHVSMPCCRQAPRSRALAQGPRRAARQCIVRPCPMAI